MFERSVTAEAQAHGVAEYPREAAGIVVDGAYIPCPNLAEKPEKEFELDGNLWEQYRGRIQGLIHSHPDAWPVPSEKDMQQQIAMDVPWGIYGIEVQKDRDGNPEKGDKPRLTYSAVQWYGRQVPKGPLRGRGFCHGHTDCLSTIEDYHALQGVILPQSPRSWEWWLPTRNEDGTITPPRDFYRDLYEPYGFERIDGPAPGAVVIGALGEDVNRVPIMTLNHAGIFLGNNLFLHHLTARDAIDPTRLSASQPFGRWGGKFNGPVIWVRHKKLPLKGLKDI